MDVEKLKIEKETKGQGVGRWKTEQGVTEIEDGRWE